MSSAISGIGAGSFLSQLQNMQRQMNNLQQAAVKPPFQPQNAPVDEVTLSERAQNTDTVAKSSAQDQVGTFESDVMLASQKSGISFEAAIQVRNKLVEAYKTVSQMQI